jgi:hypothetical protein
VVALVEVEFNHQVRFSWTCGQRWQCLCFVEVVSDGVARWRPSAQERKALKATYIPPVRKEGLGLPEFQDGKRVNPSDWRTDWGGEVGNRFVVTANSSHAEAVGAAVVYALGGTLWSQLHAKARHLDATALFKRRGNAELYALRRTPPDDVIKKEHAEAAVALMKGLAHQDYKPTPQ